MRIGLPLEYSIFAIVRSGMQYQNGEFGNVVASDVRSKVPTPLGTLDRRNFRGLPSFVLALWPPHWDSWERHVLAR